MAEPARQGDIALFSTSLRVESKVFYVDLTENTRGRCLKISEKGRNRPRSTIIVPATGLGWFLSMLDYYLHTEGEPVNKDLVVETKVISFRIRENDRGRFLSIGEAGTGQLPGRNLLVVPASSEDNTGWAAFRDSIKHVCELEPLAQPVDASVVSSSTRVGPGPSPPAMFLTASGVPSLSVGHKRFFFDPSCNDRGAFLRITEVVRQERTSITIPSEALQGFVAALEQSMAMLNVAMEHAPAAAAGHADRGAAPA